MKKQKRKTGHILNFIHNTVDTAYWVARPFEVIGVLPQHVRTAIRSTQGLLMAANMTVNILDDQANEKAHVETVNV